MKFLHAMLRVNDINKSMKFYQELLGLKLLSKSDLEDCTLYFLGEDINSPQIELTDNWEKPAEPYKSDKGFGHFAYETNDMSIFAERVKTLGYELLYGGAFKLDLKNDDGTITQKNIAFIQDPDGNEIEIIEK